MGYETFITFIACAFVCAELLAIVSASRPKAKSKRRLHHRRSFKAKLKILLFINRMLMPCRMYDRKPKSVIPQCHVCAAKGGWTRCIRSKVIAARRNIKQHDYTRRPR